MSSRSFTVFVDTPASEETETKPKPTTNTRLSRSLSESSLSLGLSPIYTTDKENLDPLTGERVGSSTALGKKRKGSISVLAVKPPLEVKLSKGKDVSASEAQPEAKKRKSSVSSSLSSKSKSKKELKAPGSGKKSAKRSSRRASPMPKLDEEVESDKEQTRVNQALINSKCYDLTVKPLADVSEAYEMEGDYTEEREVFQFVKEPSADPEIRDYFPSSSLSSSTTLRGSSPAELKTFSTPERKQIYSAFTFTSPSPTSERIAKSKRSASMPPLDFGVHGKSS
ncbi:uncharacterized protein C8R40DRAFT_1167165 [Lentinula edodes]|uniref:uncharacterized protein n=1 Tax=Lentinula edodes TaxID=5353 RepID=UPI001E8D72AE|nr:uncharacterized protein C8R40DRAFT_1167165 [Lentinula edodes]KAH7878427.1 hypothetical protein C8R40DRAFT_1167165 [Lentinula edodes]